MTPAAGRAQVLPLPLGSRWAYVPVSMRGWLLPLPAV